MNQKNFHPANPRVQHIITDRHRF